VLHAFPHAPQFALSVWSVVQLPPQRVHPCAQLAAVQHVEPEQMSTLLTQPVHCCPHPPQFALSFVVFVQVMPPHHVKPVKHVGDSPPHWPALHPPQPLMRAVTPSE
jgi:hypothetical protein